MRLQEAELCRLREDADAQKDRPEIGINRPPQRRGVAHSSRKSAAKAIKTGSRVKLTAVNTASGSNLYDRTSVVITTNPSFSEWATVFGDPKRTTTLFDRLIYRCHILETRNDRLSVKTSAAAAARKKRENNHVLPKARHPKQNLEVARFSMENPAHVRLEPYDRVIDICAGPELEAAARARGLNPDAPDRLEKETVSR